MSRPFNFTAWNKFQDQPVAYPGKIYDLADNDGISACPVGGNTGYGRVLVRGPHAHPGTRAGVESPAFAQGGRYFTAVDSCCLPDKLGLHLLDPAGATYAASGASLPVDAAGKLLVLGVGMFTEHGSCFNTPLKQPFGLGDYYYQSRDEGQIGIATEGRIWCYCETDINVGDALHFRTVVSSTTDGVQLLGAFRNAAVAVDAVDHTQPFTMGKVFRPGKAGGAFVLSLNGQI